MYHNLLRLELCFFASACTFANGARGRTNDMEVTLQIKPILILSQIGWISQKADTEVETSFQNKYYTVLSRSTFWEKGRKQDWAETLSRDAWQWLQPATCFRVCGTQMASQSRPDLGLENWLLDSHADNYWMLATLWRRYILYGWVSAAKAISKMVWDWGLPANCTSGSWDNDSSFLKRDLGGTF